MTYQQSLGLHQHTQVPGRVTICLRLINDNGIQQTLSAHRLNQRTLQSLKTLSEHVTKLFGALDHLLLLYDLKGTDSDGTAERVTTVG